MLRRQGAILDSDGNRILNSTGLHAILANGIEQPGEPGSVRVAAQQGGAILDSDGHAILAQGMSPRAMMVGPFHNDAVWPELLAKGTQGGPLYRTHPSDVADAEFGRISAHKDPVEKLAWNPAIEDAATYAPALSFVRGRRGSKYGFRVRHPHDWSTHHDHVGTPDPNDYRDRCVIGAGDGTTTTFQLRKTYRPPLAPWQTAAPLETYRAITRPIPPGVYGHSLSVWKNGVLQTEGTHYTVDYAGGRVIFITEPGGGEVIQWAGTFHVPMRFDQEVDSALDAELGVADLVTVPPLGMTEIREGIEMSDHRWRGGVVDSGPIGWDYAVRLGAAIHRVNMVVPNRVVFGPNPDGLVDGVVHCWIEHTGSQAFAIKAADAAHTTIVTSFAPGSLCGLLLRNDGTWVAIQ